MKRMTSAEYMAQYGPIASWPGFVISSIINTYPDPNTLHNHHPGRWVYQNGLVMNAMFKVWQQTKRPEYWSYMTDWLDLFIDAEGMFDPQKYRQEEYNLDNILAGRLLIYMYQETGEERYKRAAHQLMDQLKTHPRTSEGGYWHKKIYPYQMWLDGIYMAELFSLEYAQAFNNPHYFDEAVHQITLIYKHTHDPETGLLYHGWDETKTQVWAHSERGTSPEFWGRAIGWYAIALVESLDYLPADHAGRQHVLKILRPLAESLAHYQTKNSALWYQVVDKGDREDNWIETSCSAMFAYAFAKGARMGYLPPTYRDRAQKAYQSLVENYVFIDKEKHFYLEETVSVGSLRSQADYEYYVTTDRRTNDFKGVGAFLYLGLELEKDLIGAA